MRCGGNPTPHRPGPRGHRPPACLRLCGLASALLFSRAETVLVASTRPFPPYSPSLRRDLCSSSAAWTWRRNHRGAGGCSGHAGCLASRGPRLTVGPLESVSAQSQGGCSPESSEGFLPPERREVTLGAAAEDTNRVHSRSCGRGPSFGDPASLFTESRSHFTPKK